MKHPVDKHIMFVHLLSTVGQHSTMIGRLTAVKDMDYTMKILHEQSSLCIKIIILKTLVNVVIIWLFETVGEV